MRRNKTEIDYHIVGTGSKGNCVRVENIMFDCGLNFSRIKEDLYKTDVLLITHDHSDHIKPAVFDKILNEFPNIYIVGNPTVAYQYDVDRVVTTKPFKHNGWLITPFPGKHDTEVTGYVLQKDGLNIIYATDTCEVISPIDEPYDYLFLESNYDEVKLREIGKQYARRGYDPRESNLRHFSTQQCKAFYYLNRRDKESRLIELHQSERFY